jgi:hypothetical protein
LDEERILKEFFENQDVPDHLLADRDLFAWKSEAREDFNQGNGLREDILAAIRKDQVKDLQSKSYFNRQLYWLAGVAATLLIIVGAYFSFIRSAPEDTFNNPELAYLETKKVLFYVSSKLNEGTEPVATAMEKIENSTNEIQQLSKMNKGFEEMRSATKMTSGLNALNYLNLIQSPGTIIDRYTIK